MASFATSARAVDMLGRQQIASVPTAISELFKNSFDAYATRVRADYFQLERVLLLRDDGVGMSMKDVMERWLVLGTDSKAADSSRPRPPKPDHLPLRPTMGEKGIGRLAIASIGPQVVLVSRPYGSQRAKTTTALVQWSMFEIPGLVLDEVEIPIYEIEASWPSESVLREMVAEVKSNLKRLGERVPNHFRDRVHAELDSLTTLPSVLEELEGPRLEKSGHGTQFLVAPVHAELDAALSKTSAEAEANRSTDFERLLIGFTNTMLNDAPPPPMQASFVVHASEGSADLIAPSEFWGPDDFEMVDHDIGGEFDEAGHFHGNVSVYGEAPAEHVIVNPLGRTPACGPFRVRIGYLQGVPAESRLDAADFAATAAKLGRIGGLYVFRDGIRVLPYGSANVDYLGIEERRSRNAGRYYFSYRRMFGAIEISSSDNPKLRDKASREGLLDNAAFRDFRALLENFLVQTAADFFYVGGEHAEDFTERRARLKSEEKQRNQAAERLRRKRAAFVAKFRSLLDELESGRATDRLEGIVTQTLLAIESVSIIDLDDVEEGARAEIAALVASLRLVEIEQVALDEDEQSDLEAYRARESVFRTVDAPSALVRIASAVDDSGSRARPDWLAQRRAVFDSEVDSAADALQQSAETTKVEVEAASRRIQSVVEQRVATALDAITDLRAEIEDATSDEVHERVLVQVRNETFEQQEAFARIRHQLELVLDDDSAREARLLQERLIRLEKQTDADVDLLLLGQAVQVIDHELEQTVGAARRALAQVRSEAKNYPSMRQHLTDASNAFEHLDGYLRLFAPLQRRLRRQRTDIPGTRVSAFLDSLLGERLRRHKVRLKASRRFREHSLLGFPSTFLPVFVNLVDNAIYWTARAHPDGDGIIELDLDGADVVVRDNGEGVLARDADVIFASGFSRRPGGRGLGLAISRDALRREGWTLSVDPPSDGTGAVFRLHQEK